MNLTLGTLTSLKVWLLPESERAGTEWDSAITAIGKGAAGALERHCNRKFARTVDDTFECTADRAHLVLPRYPVEEITKIEIRRSMTEGWVELTDVIENQNLANGFLLFGSDLGSWSDRLRITYTGGYILPEETVATTGSSSALAALAPVAQLPADLALAWMQQCSLVWRQKDKLGSALASNNGEAAAMQIALDAGVIEAVHHYRRLSLT